MALPDLVEKVVNSADALESGGSGASGPAAARCDTAGGNREAKEDEKKEKEDEGEEKEEEGEDMPAKKIYNER